MLGVASYLLPRRSGFCALLRDGSGLALGHHGFLPLPLLVLDALLLLSYGVPEIVLRLLYQVLLVSLLITVIRWMYTCV